MDRVVLNRDEVQWFARNVIKTRVILDAASKKDPSVKERVTYKVLASLTKKAGEMAEVALQLKADENWEYELMMKPKQRKIIRGLIESSIKTLEMVVVPEYERRGEKQYLEGARSKIQKLKSMSRKFR